jgi:hypothetical protein
MKQTHEANNTKAAVKGVDILQPSRQNQEAETEAAIEQRKARLRSVWTPRGGHVDPNLPGWKRKYFEDIRALKIKKQTERAGSYLSDCYA